MFYFFYFYSVLNAITGSFFAAIFDGISPAISVRETLITTKIKADKGESITSLPTPATKLLKIIFNGIEIK